LVALPIFVGGGMHHLALEALAILQLGHHGAAIPETAMTSMTAVTAHPRPSLSHSATKLTPLLWSYASIPSLKPTYTGWWYTYPSEKYESQLGLLFPIYGKIKSCSKPPNSIVSEGC